MRHHDQTLRSSDDHALPDVTDGEESAIVVLRGRLAQW